MKRKRKEPEDQKQSDKEIIIAKIGHRNTIIVAVLTLIGTVITAYFGYLSNRQTITNPIPASTVLPNPDSTSLPNPSPAWITTPTPALPASTASPDPTSTGLPTSSSALAATPTSISPLSTNQAMPPFARDVNTGFRIVYASCNCVYYLNADESTVLVRLRWGARTAELAQQGADLISYTLIIDEKVIPSINNYRKSAVLIADPVLEKDAPDSWWVYWDVPVTLDPYIDHFIVVELKALNNVDNGWDTIPAGYVERFETVIRQVVVEIR